MERHLTRDEQVLHYYGEMSDADEAKTLAHLDGCAQCRKDLEQLQSVFALVDADRLPDADSGLESRIWQRIAPEVQSATEGTWRPARVEWITNLAWGAAAAVLVLAAFVAGRFLQFPASAPVTTTAATATTDRVFEVELDDHLNRVESALVEFIDSNEPSDSPGTEDLIAANRLYRVTALSAGNTSVAEVLDELERALIEIDAIPPDGTLDMDAVREWIDSRGLLFKLRVMREILQPAPDPGVRQDTL
jgi:hypothetical protein